MKEITVISGKGGTGKTTVTAALATTGNNLVLCDADVDAADLHLILNPKTLEKHVFEGSWLASINQDLCTQCGICMEYCRFDAIHIDASGRYRINPFKCEGCRLCERICPSGAIQSEKNTNNSWFVSSTRAGIMTHALMGPGEDNSGKLVSQVRRKAREIAHERDACVLLTDGPPGTGCSAISSISGTDLVLLVIEASRSSLHDAKRTIELVRQFNIPLFAIINKFDLHAGISDEIEAFLATQSIPLLGKIPFDESVIKAMIAGKSIAEYDPGSEISHMIKSACDKLFQKLEVKVQCFSIKSYKKLFTMKMLLRLPVLMIAFLATTSLLSFSQDKLGGLTLYTLRNDMGKNAEETLKEVAAAGYKYIEAADYRDGKFYKMTPENYKNALEKLGLAPLSAHMGSVSLENADLQIADVKAAGMKYFVLPVPPRDFFAFDQKNRSIKMKGDIKELTEFMNTLGKKCKEAGLELLYHNHDFEFKEDENGIVPIEYFLENTDPAYVNFQVDLYWVVKAGADPLAYMEKYPGRFKIWHLKDMDDQGRFAPVGTGTIDFAKILEKKEVSGMEYYIVEQDRTFDEMKPLDAIKISHAGLKKFGFK